MLPTQRAQGRDSISHHCTVRSDASLLLCRLGWRGVLRRLLARCGQLLDLLERAGEESAELGPLDFRRFQPRTQPSVLALEPVNVLDWSGRAVHSAEQDVPAPLALHTGE